MHEGKVIGKGEDQESHGLMNLQKRKGKKFQK